MDQMSIPGVNQLQQFLNSSSSSTIVQSSVGMSIETFLSSLMFSIIYCGIQILLFSSLRSKFKQFFQPLCYLVPARFRVDPPVDSFFGWFKFSFQLKFNINDYIPAGTQGLDAVLLIRFINRLAVLFLTLSLVNIPILIPLHLWGGKNPIPDSSSVRGLDVLSTSNISNTKTQIYIGHFLISLFIVFAYYYILNGELDSVVRIKHDGITQIVRQNKKRKKYLTMVLVTKVPVEQRNPDKIAAIFNCVPGGVKEVWPIYDHREVNELVGQYGRYLRLLEKFELGLITKEVQSYHCQQNKLVLPRTRSIGINPDSRLLSTMYIPIELFNSFQLPLPGFSQEVAVYEHYKEKLTDLGARISTAQRDIFEHTPDEVRFESCFIRFNTVAGAYFARQVLVSDSPDKFAIGTKVHELNPKSIIWKNVITDSQKRQSLSRYLRDTLLASVSIFIILSWVLPVAFVGSLSQLPYLTALIPTISWINNLPHLMKDFIASILPTIMLSCLTSVALNLFRWLSSKRLEKLKSEMEVNLGSWIFLFLFFHLFIVISISSGTIVILEHIISHPISVPSTVAQDFPKAANFFFSFFVLRGLTFLGNSLLQFGKFVTHQFLINFIDKTPREIFERRKGIMGKPHWGIMYSTFSVYGSIGIVYSVISPLICLFCLLNFLFDLLAFKYSFNYNYYFKNRAETFGKLYSIAVRQLHAGIYSLQIYLIGIFFLVKDEHEEKKCISIGVLMVIALFMTIHAHIRLNKKYGKLLDYMPLDRYPELSDQFSPCQESESERISLRKEYLHPCFSFDPSSQKIWIPRDHFGISESEKKFLRLDLEIEVCDDGCDISDTGLVTVTGPPPDHKW